MTKQKFKLTALPDKLFGGIRMTWLKVILFAVITALVTAALMVTPGLLNTSFRQMGTTLEAWVLFAIIIMTNCKKPLESALKTFVFFLISQPLIYLFQVPFYEGGFQIFMYYRYWFLWTLATFPMAFVGWYLTKKNWLSLLILSPMLVLLAVSGLQYIKIAVSDFPRMLLAAIFCFGQILLYTFVFFKDLPKRLVSLAIPVVACVAIQFFAPFERIGISMPLSDVHLSENAVAALADEDCGTVTISDYENAYIYIESIKSGTTTLTIKDGDKVYEYTVTAGYQDGANRITVEPKKETSDR